MRHCQLCSPQFCFLFCFQFFYYFLQKSYFFNLIFFFLKSYYLNSFFLSNGRIFLIQKFSTIVFFEIQISSNGHIFLTQNFLNGDIFGNLNPVFTFIYRTISSIIFIHLYPIFSPIHSLFFSLWIPFIHMIILYLTALLRMR